jgi:hypothetical protein
MNVEGASTYAVTSVNNNGVIEILGVMMANTIERIASMVQNL